MLNTPSVYALHSKLMVPFSGQNMPFTELSNQKGSEKEGPFPKNRCMNLYCLEMQRKCFNVSKSALLYTLLYWVSE